MASRTLGLRPDAPVQYVDVWIGLLENERENQNVFRTALSTLHDRSKEWVALPPDLKDAAAHGVPCGLAGFNAQQVHTGGKVGCGSLLHAGFVAADRRGFCRLHRWGGGPPKRRDAGTGISGGRSTR